MANHLDGLSETVKWRLLVDAAKKALREQGYTMSRIPGRGLSNVWHISKGGKTQVASIRTTRDRYIAYPPLDGGKRWKTLDDVDVVVAASVNDKHDPEKIEVYVFPADEVRKRFNDAYAARTADGQTTRDNFGMWVGLDFDKRGIASSVGAGIIEAYKPVGMYRILDLLQEGSDEADTPPEANEAASAPSEPVMTTISDVMAWARDRVAQLAGVRIEAVKLDLKIEY